MKETFSASFDHSFSLGILSHLDEPLKTDEMGKKRGKSSSIQRKSTDLLETLQESGNILYNNFKKTLIILFYPFFLIFFHGDQDGKSGEIFG